MTKSVVLEGEGSCNSIIYDGDNDNNNDDNNDDNDNKNDNNNNN